LKDTGRVKQLLRNHWVLLLLFAVAMALCWGTLDMPLLERHGFRQTQTAITVQTFINEGISLFHYQTPVLGYPYTAPFEFPIFQLSAYAMHRLIGGNLDVSMRLASLAWFFLSALLLDQIGRLWFRDSRVRYCILGFYLLNPFSLFWSRTSMIDFCSVALSLAFLLASMRWLRLGGWRDWLLGIVLGSLAYLAKATSVLPAVFVLAGYWYARLNEKTKEAAVPSSGIFLDFRSLKTDRKHLMLLAVLVALPLLVGYLWVIHTDAVKLASGQKWLTSASLKTWNFGTWDQKTNLANWGIVFSHVTSHATPWALTLLLMIPVVGSSSLKAEETSAARLCLLAALATQFTYFNLYFVHDYYAIALMPYVAVACGVGAMAIVRYISSVRITFVRFSLLGALLIIVGISLWGTTDYLKLLYGKERLTYGTHPVVQLGRFLERMTKETDTIIVTDNDWSSDLLYYAKRKGLMLRKGKDQPLPPGHPDRVNARVLASREPENYPQLFASFPRIESLGVISGFHLYLINESGALTPSSTLGPRGIENRRSPCNWRASKTVASHIEKALPDPAPSFRAEISGWAFADPQGTHDQTVVILLENPHGLQYFFEAEPVERPDVCDYFKNNALLRSGFRCMVRSSDLPPGQYSIRVLVGREDDFQASGPSPAEWIR